MALSTRKLALKKQANEELFGEIKLELEDALQEDDDEKFTVDRLRAKFKWLKKECPVSISTLPPHSIPHLDWTFGSSLFDTAT